MGNLRTLIDDKSAVDDSDRTIELTFSTGAKGLRNGWDGQYYEELSMDPKHLDMSRLQSGAPLLAAHDSFSLDAVIGVVERAWIEGNVGKALVRFSEDPDADKIFKKVKEKVLRNVSIGYQVRKYEDVSEKGDAIPTYRAVDYAIHEISIVPIGFDKMAQIRNQENQTLTEVEIETTSVDDEPIIKEASVMTEEEKRALELAAAKKAADAEKQRQADIRTAVRSAKLEASFVDELCNADITADEARKRVLVKLAEAQPEPVKSTIVVEMGVDERDKKREAIIEAVLHRTDSQLFKPTEGNPFVHMTMLRMLEAFTPNRFGMSDSKFATRAMSSSDLPYILSNVAEKAAQAKYAIQPRTWSRWAAKDSLRNYKTKDILRSGDFASLEERSEHSEFKRGSFGEEREQVALKDWGKILPFTRRMLINDDLGEIAKITSQAGVAAARLENRLVYAILTGNPEMGDGENLFSTAHANKGTGAALTDASIGEAFKLMRQQETVDGEDKLNLAPKYLICGPENEVAAKKYLAQITPNQSSNVNLFSNSLELIIDSEISTNDYYFAADQNLIPTVTLYHLEGEEQPRVESRVNFENESVEIKCAHAAVAAVTDYRGLVINENA